ncbi:hypothetical protein A0K93_11160 [Corynebacterium sp. BCW_4722]|nr:hypothetical protein A0K93_11160 [Corynebacterium sp. BCW_4722]
MIAPYHRLALTERTRAFSAWRPVIEIAVVLALFAVVQVVWVFGAAAVFGFSWIESVVLDAPVDEFGQELDSNPATMVFTYGAIAATTPVAFVAAWAAGRKPRFIWSVEGRWRWRPFFIALLATGGPIAAIFAADLLMFGEVPAGVDRTFWACLAVALTVIPVQCLAEELIFRGSLTQSIGAWTKSPWLAYLLPVPLFIIGHPYDAAGMLSVGLFALAASFLVHRTGGLESAAAVHMVNNVSISYGMFSGIAAEEGPRYWLFAVTDLALVASVVGLAVATTAKSVVQVVTTDAQVRSLPSSTGELAGPAGVRVAAPWVGQSFGAEPDGWAANARWHTVGDNRARLTRDGLELNLYASPSAVELRVRNTSRSPRPIQLALLPQWNLTADGTAYGLEREVAPGIYTAQGSILLIDASRSITLSPTGADHILVRQPGIVGPALLGEGGAGVVLAPGEEATVGFHVEAT